MKKSHRKIGRLKDYGIATLSTAAAFAITDMTWPWLQPTPWAFFFAAVMLSAWFGGMGPGLLATLASAVLGHGFFIAPHRTLAFDRNALTPTATFLFISLFIGVLASVRRRAEATERTERRRFRATMTSIGDAVIATDAVGRVSFMNNIAEELTGWMTADASGRPLEEVFVIINETTREIVPNPVAKVLESGHIQGLANHTVLIARDGRERPIDDSAAPIRDDDGEIAGVVLVFRDISERRDAETVRARLAAIVESSDDAIVGKTLDGVIRYWNAGAERVFGYAAAEAVGQPITLIIPVDRLDEERDILARLRQGERIDHFETVRLTKDGRRVDISLTVSPIRDERGCIIGASKVARDVTARKQYEAALREKEERLKLLLENTKDYAVVISDPSGVVLEWQGAAERISGYSPEEAVGQGPGLLFTPEDRAHGRPEYEMSKAAREGRAEDKRWHRRKDDSRFYADGVMTALYDDAGRLRGFGKVFKDATREKQAEEATKRRAAQLHMLAGIANRINSAHDVHSVVRVVTAEACRLFGARQAATSMVVDPNRPQPIHIVSRSGEALEVNQPDVDALDIYQAIRQADEPIRVRRDDIDASPAWQAMRKLAGVAANPNGWLVAPLVGRNGRGMGLIQLADRSEGEFTEDDEAVLVQLAQLTAIAVENARLYQELRTNDERKNEFLAMLAHELRNPLAAINNAVKLTSRSRERDHLDWSIEVITRQMQHLSRLIDDLMDVSRITRGKIELRRVVMEATPILESAAVTVKSLVEERKHTLELDVERGGLWVNVDPTRLEQVVVNLLNNAAKYSENSGLIRLSARNEAGEVVIAVKDRGVGIPVEKLPEMFELFAQGDRSLARSEGGLGIGLTIVKKLVEMHGGTIDAKSEGPGQGSEFTIRLPAARRPNESQPGSTDQEAEPGRKARILIVDDNVDTARGMACLLKLIGHEVATAHSGPEALEVARGQCPEFVLLDIGLPGLSGYEVAALLRREECCRDAVIVAVSGYGQEEDRRRSREAGFDFHLVKPLDHDVLMTLLSSGSIDQS